MNYATFAKRLSSYTLPLLVFGLVACSDDPDSDNGPADSGTSMVDDAGLTPDASVTVDAGMVDGGPPPTKIFQIKIENTSQTTSLPTGFSSGVWATHAESTPFFSAGEVDRAEGLEALAEDGDPSALVASLPSNQVISNSGELGNPTGTPAGDKEAVAGLALPGQAFEFTVTTNALSPYLSFASMLAESNDLFLSPGSSGFRLFDDAGNPIANQEITSNIELWDLGTEANEAPGSGRNQAPRQANAGDGNPEGVVHPFNYSTRSLPLAIDILDVSAAKISDDTLRITVTNTSQDKGAFGTNLSPVFWVSHSEAWSLFAPKSQASAGLARMVEDGVLADLETEHASALGVGVARAEEDKAGPGESYSFDVTASMQQAYLTFAIALNECNDAFVSLPPEGIKLLDDDGRLRAAEDVSLEINRRLVVWDAGTERNEPPGIGPTQVARQTPTNRGVEDAVAEVRRYNDSVNDLSGPRVGGIVNLTVEGGFTGEFTVTLENTSDSSNFPTRLSSLVWILHDGGTKIFADGSAASPQLEQLAEDGNTDGLKGELNSMANVTAEIVRTPDGASGQGLAPGQRYIWTIIPSLTQRAFNFATMLESTNDAFLALGPEGINLLDGNGQPRSNNDIASDIAAKLAAWDAGTEANQSGGAGPDQGANQLTSGRGPSEGNGLVRKYGNEVWSYPAVGDMVKVSVTLME